MEKSAVLNGIIGQITISGAWRGFSGMLCLKSGEQSHSVALCICNLIFAIHADWLALADDFVGCRLAERSGWPTGPSHVYIFTIEDMQVCMRKLKAFIGVLSTLPMCIGEFW